MTSIDTGADITELIGQINLVEQEHARLTQGEWVLLQMLKRAVEIIEAIDDRTMVHRARLNRLTGDGK